MDDIESLQRPSSLLTLPKELRLAIYEFIFASQESITVGNRAVNNTGLNWPLQPGISRTCKVLRKETLCMYYASSRLHLNVQRPNGEAVVLQWLDSLETSSIDALNEIKHAVVVTGSGLEEPAKEYGLDPQLPSLFSASRPYAAEYLYTRGCNMLSWTPLRSEALRERLQQLPGKESATFSVARVLCAVIETAREPSASLLHSFFFSTPDASTNTELEPDPANHQSRHCTLLEMPKELRLAVYEYVFASECTVTIGQRAIHTETGPDQYIEPALSHTCSLTRNESLPVFFASTHFTLNIQRTPCLGIVLAWLDRCSHAYPEAFPNLRHVSIIAGSGIRQPPREFTLDMHCNALGSVTMRMPLQAYRLSPIAWSPPPWAELNNLLRRLTRKGEDGYDIKKNLSDVLLLLSRYTD